MSHEGNARNGSSGACLPVGVAQCPSCASAGAGPAEQSFRGAGGHDPPDRTMRARNAFTLSGVSAPSSTQAALRAHRFLAVTMAAGCSAGRLSLPVFTPHGTLADAAFDLGVTIAFRFRCGRL